MRHEQVLTKAGLLAFLKEKAANPLSFNELAARLKLSPPEKRSMKKLLRDLVQGGEIVRTRKGLYGPAGEMSLVTGYFEAHRDGYGFVILDTPGERDVFIPSRCTAGAMDNDRVVARLENRGRREGRIIRILERTTTRVAGTFERGRAAFFVRPKKRSIPFDLYVSPDDRGEAEDGDSVVAEIVSYPTDKRPAAGKIVKVLKRPQSPREEIELILDELSLHRRFPQAVQAEAKDLHERPLETGAEGLRRKDLRSLPTVTIDGERAKDFDDAVSIARTGDGGYRLWVHIADVGHFVPWDTVIDKEARKRGTSVYFADRVIPMLPRELSEDLCSLRPKVDRFAFTVEMEFDEYGERAGSNFYPSIIRSDERMTYTAVRGILVDRDGETRRRYNALLEQFELMEALCNAVKAKRLKRGSLDFDLPEPEVLLDLQGRPEDIIRAERNFAHMVIEEFMIAANEAVAEFLEAREVPCIYRIHEEPDPLKCDEIRALCDRIGLQRSRKPVMPGELPKLIRKVQGTPLAEVVTYIVLRSLKQAKYAAVNVGHFGLASGSYCHFTSPIRRYPDLVVHRILRETLVKKHIPDKRLKELEASLPDTAFHSSRMERLADDAERQVLAAMRAWFMRDRVGETFEASVVSIAAYGLKVRLKDFYVEGFLHVSYMADDFYTYDERQLSLVGTRKKKRYTIGQDITVKVDSIDMSEREIIFSLE